VGAPLEPAPQSVRRLLDPDAIEEAFLATEFAFDALKLRERIRADLGDLGVPIRLRTRAVSVAPAPGGMLAVELDGPGGPEVVRARQVFNCTYSGINHLLGASGLPVIPLKHEATEMALVVPPAELAAMGVTVMCGPFFSIMPFPPRGLHTLSHVRYTPHREWHDRPGSAPPRPDRSPELRSHQEQMIRDAARYVPCVSDCRYVESVWEVKTVLPASEQDDSRPILFRPDHGLPGLTCIMGGKIDNVFDVMQEIDVLRARGGLDR
jgi:glycine/D-amino acid oxidase-like deaminating enzyme